MGMNFRILHYETVHSTNNLARELAGEGAGEGTVVCADYQTRGRGRFKRRWVSTRGRNLLFSIILRPHFPASSASIVTHVAAKAVQEVLKEKFGLDARLKRPNDVLIGKKKIAGILTESCGAGSRLDYMVVGIGLNVNSTARQIPKRATSVFIETKAPQDLNTALNYLLIAFGGRYKITCADYGRKG